MASRNRVIYQSEGLYVSENAALTAAIDHEQLERVQSANYSYTINRQDVNQYGELARLDSLVLDPPTVSVDFSYLITDGFNERALGFFVQNTGAGAGSQRGAQAGADTVGNFASGHMVATSGVNIFVTTSPDGTDLNGQGALDATDTVIGIGNCYISDYSIDLSVGALPTASVTMEGANMRSDTSGNNFRTPAINQEDGNSDPSNAAPKMVILPDPVQTPGGQVGSTASGPRTINALRPGDITLHFADVEGETVAELSGTGPAHVQSVSISLPLSRTPLQRLGSKFPFARSVDFPVNVSLSASAIMNQTDANNLAAVLDSGSQTVGVSIKDTEGYDAVRYELKEAKLDSESFSSSIGSNKTVDLTFSAQVGGPNDDTAGLFMSGVNGAKVFEA